MEDVGSVWKGGHGIQSTTDVLVRLPGNLGGILILILLCGVTPRTEGSLYSNLAGAFFASA